MPEKPGFPNDQIMLFSRMMWLIRIRWVALFVALAFCSILAYLDVIPESNQVIITLAVLGILNLLYSLSLKRDFPSKWIGLKGACLVQILVDILALLTLIHFTGGLTNPFLFFLSVPVVIAGINFQPRWTYLIAALTWGLAALMGFLESRGWLVHHPIKLFDEPEDAAALHAWMSASIIALGALLFISAYLGCEIVGALRKREWHLAQVLTTLLSGRRGRAAAADQRRKALAGLSNGMKRDIKDPLGIIRARLDAMRYELEDNDQLDGAFDKDLNIIGTKVEEIEITLEKITTFLSRGTAERTTLDPASILDSSFGEIAKRCEESGISTRLEISRSLPTIEGSGSELRLLFSSVLENAVEALGNQRGGRISLHARHLHGESDQVIVRVRDNGPGIPPEVQKRIFDPYFSTRSRDRGMGLAIAYTIVRNHGGELRIRSRPPPGTSVVILLPLAQPTSSPVE